MKSISYTILGMILGLALFVHFYELTQNINVALLLSALTTLEVMAGIICVNSLNNLTALMVRELVIYLSRKKLYTGFKKFGVGLVILLGGIFSIFFSSPLEKLITATISGPLFIIVASLIIIIAQPIPQIRPLPNRTITNTGGAL